MTKMMRADPPDLWSGGYSGKFEKSNYGSGLAGKVMAQSHRLIESEFGDERHFDKVLEVGAGSGVHLDFVRHKFNEYWLTDFSTEMLEASSTARRADNIIVSAEDARKLSFPDDHFDRVIACHVLEHIYEPHLAIKEWVRVLKPNGVLSLVLPCDPGLLWRLGRNFGPRKTAKKNGLHYDYIMAREHVNPINNLVAFIDYYFEHTNARWWPMRIPLSDINLIYAVNIAV